MNNIYKRVKQIWNQAIIAEETDKIKDINYEVDEERSGIKSGKRYHYSSISFHFIKDSEKILISLIKTEEPDHSHITMSYDNFKEWSFYIVGNPTRTDIRPYSLLIEHSPQEVSSILDELEEALCEASGKVKQYWKKLDEFGSICSEIVGEDGGMFDKPLEILYNNQS